MGRNSLQYAEISEICPKFSLAPIEDDDSYRAAIEILDRLFERDDLRTPEEVKFFRALARMASEYEMSTAVAGAQTMRALGEWGFVADTEV